MTDKQINPNLKKLAELTCNPNLAMPDLEKIVEEAPIQINKLERDAQGNLTIKLTPLKNTAVNPKTKEEYNTLMQVYECGGWRWNSEDLPTSNYKWEGEEISITAGYDFYTKTINIFGWGEREFYLGEGWKVIPTKEFYNKQNITSEMINEINKYFENER